MVLQLLVGGRVLRELDKACAVAASAVHKLELAKLVVTESGVALDVRVSTQLGVGGQSAVHSSKHHPGETGKSMKQADI